MIEKPISCHSVSWLTNDNANFAIMIFVRARHKCSGRIVKDAHHSYVHFLEVADEMALFFFVVGVDKERMVSKYSGHTHQI